MKQASFRYLTKLQKEVLIPPFAVPWWPPPSAQLHSANNLKLTPCQSSKLQWKGELSLPTSMYPFREESEWSDLGHVTYPSPTSLFMKDSYLASLGQILTPMAEIRDLD